MSDAHPAAVYEPSVAQLARRARLASLALGGMIASYVWVLFARGWTIRLIHVLGTTPDGKFVNLPDDEAGAAAVQQSLDAADLFVSRGVLVLNVLFWVTAVLFLMWVHRLVKLTRALDGQALGWKPRDAVWAFIVPIISLYRPYKVLRDAQDVLNPERVTPPPPRIDRDASNDYRSAVLVTPPLAKALPNAMLGLWWGSFVLSNVFVRVTESVTRVATTATAIESAYELNIVVDSVKIFAAVFAIRVVVSLTARLQERFRRIRYSTPESLEAQQIHLGS